MGKNTNNNSIKDYKFHHIDTSKCKNCKDFSCEAACFRGIYKIINKESIPRCIVYREREDFCIKCYLCTTMCKKKAILID